MANKSDIFMKVLREHYNLIAEPDDILETFVSGAQKQRFWVDDDRYNLVHIPKDAFDIDKFECEMANFEFQITVKSYERVAQKIPIDNYILYRLIPYTVQGFPDW